MADIILAGSTSGSITVSSPAVSGTNTLTLPVATDTLVGKATTDTLTNKSIAATQLTGTVAVANGGTGVTASKQLIQNLNTMTGAVATGTTTIPNDDTIPQNTEGNQFMTLAITPTSATSVLEINVHAFTAHGSAAYHIIALFQDTTANAIATIMSYVSTSNPGPSQSLFHRMVSGTTSATTFKVRIGCEAGGTITFNGEVSGRRMGGVMASSITIKEYTA